MLYSKRKTFLDLTLLVAIFFGATGVTSIRAAEIDELTFEGCLEEALNNHPSLKSTKTTISAAIFQRENAEAAFFPSTRTYLRGEINRSSLLGDSVAAPKPDFSRSYAYGVELSQNVFRGGGDKASLEKARISEDAAQLDQEKIRIALAHQVRSAYIDVLYGQELLKLNNTLKLRREENLKLVSLKHTSGQENKGSVMRSAALLTESEADLALAKDLLVLASMKLNTLTQKINLSKPIRAQGQLESFIIASDLNESETLENLLEMRIFSQKIEEAEAQAEIVGSSRYPTLDFTLGASNSGAAWPLKMNRLYAGLSANYDIDLFRIKKREGQLARLTVDKLKADFVVLRDSLRLGLISAKYKLKEAEANATVTEDHLRASETQAHIARTSYNLGLKSFQEWDQLENDLVLKKKMYLANVKERAQRSADLLKESDRMR